MCQDLTDFLGRLPFSCLITRGTIQLPLNVKEQRSQECIDWSCIHVRYSGYNSYSEAEQAATLAAASSSFCSITQERTFSAIIDFV
jgi:hypothetical protein